jgi:hypothetical protein
MSGLVELGHSGGVRVIESPLLTEGPFEDWSDVRSIGRATRRRKLGHKQRIRFFYKPSPTFYRYGDTIVGHPELVAALRARAAQEASS